MMVYCILLCEPTAPRHISKKPLCLLTTDSGPSFGPVHLTWIYFVQFEDHNYPNIVFQIHDIFVFIVRCDPGQPNGELTANKNTGFSGGSCSHQLSRTGKTFK